MAYVGPPPGTLFAFAATSPPTGYLLCDGSAVSRTTYADLFAAISTTYGVGNGTTTFNVPDLQGRTAVGVGTHSDVNALNKNDGLTVGSRRPKHKHTMNESAHSHSLGGSFDLINHNPSSGSTGNTTGDRNTPNVSGTSSATTGITAGPQTGSEPVDTPAFVTVNYIIKF